MCYLDWARTWRLSWIVYSYQAHDIYLSRLVQKGSAAYWKNPSPELHPRINLQGMKPATYLQDIISHLVLIIFSEVPVRDGRRWDQTGKILD
jgi:hypothetical protein